MTLESQKTNTIPSVPQSISYLRDCARAGGWRKVCHKKPSMPEVGCRMHSGLERMVCMSFAWAWFLTPHGLSTHYLDWPPSTEHCQILSQTWETNLQCLRLRCLHYNSTRLPLKGYGFALLNTKLPDLCLNSATRQVCNKCLLNEKVNQ